MKHRALLVILAFLFAIPAVSLRATSGAPNPAIDMEGYLSVSMAAARHRETRRLSEDAFIRMSREEGTIVLDARSRQKFEELHNKGAINLTDHTIGRVVYPFRLYRPAGQGNTTGSGPAAAAAPPR